MYYEHLSREKDSSFAIMAAPRDDLILVSVLCPERILASHFIATASCKQHQNGFFQDL